MQPVLVTPGLFTTSKTEPAGNSGPYTTRAWAVGSVSIMSVRMIAFQLTDEDGSKALVVLDLRSNISCCRAKTWNVTGDS